MTRETIITVIISYFTVGFIYWFINGAIRKLSAREDVFISSLWLAGWPLCLLTLAISKLQEMKDKL